MLQISTIPPWMDGSQAKMYEWFCKFLESGTDQQLQKTNTAGVIITDKSVLIMDEVDGMSAGDRGGVVALKALIKKTQVDHSFPIFSFLTIGSDTHNLHSQRCPIPETQASYGRCCIHSLHQVRSLLHLCFDSSPSRPPAAQVKSRIATICYKCVIYLDSSRAKYLPERK